MTACLLALGTYDAQARGGRGSSSNTGSGEIKKPAEDSPSGSTDNVPKNKEKTFPTGQSWVLISLNGKSVGSGRPTFSLDEALRARGFGGCNTFSATAYPLRQQRFAVGPIALTKKACAKPVMDQERQFLVLFRTAQMFDIQDGQLVLQGQAGTLRFERGI